MRGFRRLLHQVRQAQGLGTQKGRKRKKVRPFMRGSRLNLIVSLHELVCAMPLRWPPLSHPLWMLLSCPHHCKSGSQINIDWLMQAWHHMNRFRAKFVTIVVHSFGKLQTIIYKMGQTYLFLRWFLARLQLQLLQKAALFSCWIA